MQTRQDILVAARGISKQFGSRTVLSHISVEIAADRHILISGPSGSGKTTLLRLLALLDKPEDGAIWYRDMNVTSYTHSPQAAQRAAGIQIGYVSQDRDLWPHLTVGENVELALRLTHTSAEIIADRAASALESLGLAAERDKYPPELSGGQRQRSAIARSLVHRPEVLLLDEITASLDAENVRKVMAAVEVAVEQGATIALVSHLRSLPTDLLFAEMELPGSTSS